jgi:hypothetical protein
MLLRREPDNNYIIQDVIVGHVPYNLAPIIEKFLRREPKFNTGIAEVIV